MTGHEEHDDISVVGLWVGLAIGGPLMAFAPWGLFAESAATDPPAFARWFIGGVVVHDLVLAPLVCGAGILLGRALGPPWRAPVRTGLFASAVVLAVGWAPLWGTGRDRVPDNPSVQPLAYGTAVATVLGLVWLGVALWLIVVAVRHRNGGRPA